MDPALPQHPLFAAALTRIGGAAGVVDTADGLVVLVRRRIGPLRLAAALRAPPLSAAALRGLRARGLRLCEPDAVAPMRAAGFRQVMTPAHVAELPLAGDAAARRARMAGKWRNRLHRAEAAGLRLREMPFDGPAAAWLIAQEDAQRRARGYRALPARLALAWAATAPSAARLFVAERDGARIAAMLFLIHGRAATYQLGWTGPLGRASSAHHLLLASAADRLADRGIARIDLGTVDTDAAPGLARFKLGAGADLRALGGSWIAVPGL